MREIYERLYVGDQNDYELSVKGKSDWAVVQACKEPYHRQALGYKTQGAPKDHPEYLLARRGNKLILNLVDVDNPEWISPIIIDTALSFIQQNLQLEKKVLIHCNQGMSRSAGIGFLYLATKGYFEDIDINKAELKYMEIYPNYKPANGIRGYIYEYWNKYCMTCQPHWQSLKGITIISDNPDISIDVFK